MAAKQKDHREPDWAEGLYRRGKWFHYRRMFDGKRYSKPLRTKNPAHANRLALELNASIEDKKVAPTTALQKGKVELQDAAEEFLETRALRSSTIQRYRGIVSNLQGVFVDLLGKPEVLLSDIDESLLKGYIQKRATEPSSRNGHPNTRKTLGAKPKTINGELALLKSVLKLAVARGWIAVVPNMSDVRIKGVRRKGKASEIARPLTEDEVTRLLAAAENYDKSLAGSFAYPAYFHSIICTFVYAGLRHEECQLLEWRDLDFNEELIHIRSKTVVCRRRISMSPKAWRRIEPLLSGQKPDDQALPDDPETLDIVGNALRFRARAALLKLRRKDFKPDDSVIHFKESFRWMTKASQGDVVMHPRLKEILAGLQGEHGSNFVFPDSDGGYWRMHFERHFLRIREMARIADNIRVHDLRHTTGAMLRRNGVALETIKELLRHANLGESLIYARYERQEGKTAIRKLPTF